MSELTHYIDGAHVQGTSGRTQPVFNSAIGASETSVPLSSVDEVNTAIAAAKAAWPAWSKTRVLRRARIFDEFKNILWDRADELATILASEHGKTHDDALGEVTRGLEVVEFAIGAPTFMEGEFSENVGSVVDSHNIRQALGVCAGITPFNFPDMVPMWMFPVALAAPAKSSPARDPIFEPVRR
jgi:malonate-semialdehyde dehydrogenase (acetylating)/methylmalonate-semialdehyde dehydrogenase